MKNKLEIIESKIMTLDSLMHLVNAWRLKSQKVVFTNGCFDILHRGHVKLLLKAADLGHRLVVGLNTDASVRRLKQHGRPINQEKDRALLLAAQTYVNAVVLFDEDTPLELIKAIKPEVLVKGGDYKFEEIVGADFVRANSGSVEIIPLAEGYSTTKIIEKLKASK